MNFSFALRTPLRGSSNPSTPKIIKNMHFRAQYNDVRVHVSNDVRSNNLTSIISSTKSNPHRFTFIVVINELHSEGSPQKRITSSLHEIH